MLVPFFVYSASTGGLLSGLTLDFEYYKRRNEDGTITDLADPVITENPAGSGRYEFTIPDADLSAGSIIDYVVDCGATATARYLEGHVDSDEVNAEEAEEVEAGVVLFGVTAATVRTAHFPHWSSFSATTKPTSTQVTTFITEEAADLGGDLKQVSVSPAGITSSGTPNAYAWCQKTLKLMVAIRVAKVATAANPDIAKAWQEDLDRRLKKLKDHGATLLVDASATETDSPPGGPTSHISQYGLTVDEATNMSTTVPRLRRDDEL